jgi:pilus assembly protein Flp/PilA
MRWKLWSCYGAVHALVVREEGQDLMEYALVFAVIALAATAGMQGVAGGVNSVFTTVAATLASATA